MFDPMQKLISTKESVVMELTKTYKKEFHKDYMIVGIEYNDLHKDFLIADEDFKVFKRNIMQKRIKAEHPEAEIILLLKK